MWTVEKWNAALAWTATVVVFLFAGNDMPRSFRLVYDQARKGKYLRGAPQGWVYGWVWSVIAALLIVGGILYSITYEACNNDYYIATFATSLAHVAFLGMWGRLFWYYRSPGAAFIDMLFILGTGIATVVLMALTATSSCATGKTEAWIAFAFWLVPHVWYIYAAIINWQWVYIPEESMRAYYKRARERLDAWRKRDPLTYPLL